MDILYIVGRGSKFNNIELRMSLRSIAKYGKNIGKVIVAGYPPAWLSDEVVKVPVDDVYNRKHLNLMYCLREVVKGGWVKGEFLYSSDDHFYCKEVDFDNYPFYYKEKALRDKVFPGERCYAYHECQMLTRELLQKHGLPYVNYEQHCNTHMHAQVFSDFSDLVQESFDLVGGAIPTTLIMNAWSTTPYAPDMSRIVKRVDLKLGQQNTEKDIEDSIGRAECFSICNAAFRSKALIYFFAHHYGTPCKFEKLGIK